MIKSILDLISNIYSEGTTVSSNIYIRTKNFYNDNISSFFEAAPIAHNDDKMDGSFVVIPDPYRLGRTVQKANIVPIGDVTNNVDPEITLQNHQ